MNKIIALTLMLVASNCHALISVMEGLPTTSDAVYVGTTTPQLLLNGGTFYAGTAPSVSLYVGSNTVLNRGLYVGSSSDPGVSGYQLISAGPDAAPTWNPPAAGNFIIVYSTFNWNVGQLFSTVTIVSTATYVIDFEGVNVAGTAGGSFGLLRFNGDSAANYLWADSGIQTANASNISSYQGSASATNTGINLCYVGSMTVGSWCSSHLHISTVYGTPKTMVVHGTQVGLLPGNYNYQTSIGGSYVGTSTSYTIAISTFNGSTALGGSLKIWQETP